MPRNLTPIIKAPDVGLSSRGPMKFYVPMWRKPPKLCLQTWQKGYRLRFFDEVRTSAVNGMGSGFGY